MEAVASTFVEIILVFRSPAQAKVKHVDILAMVVEVCSTVGLALPVKSAVEMAFPTFAPRQVAFPKPV